MNDYKKLAAAASALLLLLGIAGYRSPVEASADRAGIQSEADARAEAEQGRKKFKSLLDQQQQALSGPYQPGEIRYVYINDKEYHASFSSALFMSNSYSLVYRNYDEYAEKYAAGKNAMPLELKQLPDGYNFTMARVAPYLTWSEQKKLSNQVIAEGKASGKKIFVKKLQEKRTSVELIYTMAAPVNGISGVLAITAEPAGVKDKTVESEPIKAQSEKLKIGGQEVVYTQIDKQEYKSVAWMNSKTRVNYIIRENRGHLTKEELIALAGQVIGASN